MDEQQLAAELQKLQLNAVRSFDTIGSTNDEALRWIDEGAHDLSLVVSDEQTKGRGRFDRRWISKPGSSLAFSLILKPNPQESASLPLFAPLCGLAVRNALYDLYDLNAEIKWPNDVLINRRKVCGILVEAAWLGSEIKGVVLGIGVNIHRGSVPDADSQLFEATCLEDALDKPVYRLDVLGAVVSSIKKWRPLLGSDAFFSEWQKVLAFKGERVKIVESEKQSIIGIEKGINREGKLVLILENREERAFEVGDVHLRLADFGETGGRNAR